jgi:hypothetical protein
MSPDKLKPGYVFCECQAEGRYGSVEAGVVIRDIDCRCAIKNEIARRHDSFSDDAAIAVFQQILLAAWDDYMSTPPARPKGADAMKAWRAAMRRWREVRSEADLFLNAKAGPWARAREVICALAGLDPDAVKSKASKKQPSQLEDYIDALLRLV